MSTIVPYTNPYNQNPLESSEIGFLDKTSGDFFKIIEGVPRFCSQSNYAESFGYQWQTFDRTQFDSHSGVTHSAARFFGETGWKAQDLENDRVLEVGSGAGRFSEVFLSTTKGTLHSVDYSDAVEANWRNNGHYGTRFRLAQASIYEMPYPDNSFDKIFCLGVLQHTPSFEESVHSLIRKARIDGEIVVDFYPIKGWYTKIHAKYLIRPITKRIRKEKLLLIIKKNVDWLLWIFDLLCSAGLGILTRFLPITDVRMFPRDLSATNRREWTIMDTFDGLSPQYDNPQRLSTVVRMFERYGCEVKFAGLAKFRHGNATVVRAIKRR